MYEHLAQAEQEAAELEHRLKVEEKEHGNGAGLKGCASVHFFDETAATRRPVRLKKEVQNDQFIRLYESTISVIRLDESANVVIRII